MNEFDRIKQIRALAEARNRDVSGLVWGIGDAAAVTKSFAATDWSSAQTCWLKTWTFAATPPRPDLLCH
jgi:hypothetical protein